MSCCAPALAAAAEAPGGPSDDEVRLLSRDLGEGRRQSDFSVPSIHCGACIRAVETGLAALPGVEAVRANLSAKRVRIVWREAAGVPPMAARLRDLGYEPNLYAPEPQEADRTFAHLLRALAVAAFASMNIMMLSGSVWSGADAASRDLLHWLCALLTLPALLYSGRVFYRSAFNALRHGRTNMDVPIAIGILATFALSLYDTATSGDRVYYDAVASLIFFLLIGRTLDHAMREKARSAVRGLARLAPAGALVLDAEGGPAFLPIGELRPGMTISVPPGGRLPVDGVVAAGTSTLDRSLLTGESLPEPVGPGEAVAAGALNLSAPLTVTVGAEAGRSTLSRLMQLLEDAESGRNRYRRIADRAAALYAPLVHLAALLAFAGWMVFARDPHQATTVAVAVLIITCPCALGLAVPMVQVVAARRLFEAGILMKDGAGLERLAEIDTVVFDKTGTLTAGLAAPAATGAPEHVALAASLAARSRHPYALAIARGFSPDGAAFEGAEDHPGLGVEARLGGAVYRLGRHEWAAPGHDAGAGSVLSRDGVALARFSFEDGLRPGAAAAIAELRRRGLAVEMLSGDRAEAVERLAGRLGIAARGGLLPGGKLARLEALAAAGHRVLMVGDGLNDTPAMAAAHAAMAPAEAADIGRSAADFVFLRNDLMAVPQALAIAAEAARLVRQNLGLALAYNALALPVAVAGLVNPFLAAIAMSLSSVVVVLNALRLGWSPFRPAERFQEKLHDFSGSKTRRNKNLEHSF